MDIEEAVLIIGAEAWVMESPCSFIITKIELPASPSEVDLTEEDVELSNSGSCVTHRIGLPITSDDIDDLSCKWDKCKRILTLSIKAKTTCCILDTSHQSRPEQANPALRFAEIAGCDKGFEFD